MEGICMLTIILRKRFPSDKPGTTIINVSSEAQYSNQEVRKSSVVEALEMVVTFSRFAHEVWLKEEFAIASWQMRSRLKFAAPSS
jgi:hypothetical protein